MLAKLKDLGLDDRTLVVFTSDNGPWYGGSTGGLRGHEGDDLGGRLPGAVHRPLARAGSPPGKVRRRPAVMMDLFATALAAAGVAAAARPRDRRQGPAAAALGRASRPCTTSSSGTRGPRLATVRDARWKLHVLPARDRRDGKPGERWVDPRGPDGVTILAPYEQAQPAEYPGLRTGDETGAMSLFDLANDPAEQHDVAAEHPDVVARLKAHYDRVVKEFPAGSPDRSAPATP